MVAVSGVVVYSMLLGMRGNLVAAYLDIVLAFGVVQAFAGARACGSCLRRSLRCGSFGAPALSAVARADDTWPWRSQNERLAAHGRALCVCVCADVRARAACCGGPQGRLSERAATAQRFSCGTVPPRLWSCSTFVHGPIQRLRHTRISLRSSSQGPPYICGLRSCSTLPFAQQVAAVPARTACHVLRPGPSGRIQIVLQSFSERQALPTVPRWRVTDGGWRVTDGGWRVTDGGWRVTNGGWRVTDGGWRVTVSTPFRQ